MDLLADNPPECVHEEHIEIPWSSVKKVRSRFVAVAGKEAVVQGFRRGRVPASVLVRRFERELVEALKDGLIPRCLSEAAAHRDIHVAYGPVVTDVKYREGQPLEAAGVFEVFPKFEIGEYRGLELLRPQVEATDEMVANRLEELREQHATYQNLDPRPIADGDIALVSLKGQDLSGEQAFDLEEEQVRVGHSTTIPEFSEALRGSVPGDALEFEVAFPAGHRDRKMAGKTLRVEGRVTALQVRELPDLDDELAKDIDSGTDTLEELREAVRKEVEVGAREQVERLLGNQVYSLLARANTMPLPVHFLRDRVDQAWSAVRREAGLPKDAPIPDDLENRYIQRESVRTRAELVLMRIALLEGISVPAEEIDQFVRAYGQEQQMTPERAAVEARDIGLLEQFKLHRILEKALRFVLDEAEYLDAASDDEPEEGRELNPDAGSGE